MPSTVEELHVNIVGEIQEGTDAPDTKTTYEWLKRQESPVFHARVSDVMISRSLWL